jgi:hypothetical protein
MAYAETIVLRGAEGSPNGVKICDGMLYCSTASFVPPPAGCIYQVEPSIAAPAASGPEPAATAAPAAKSRQPRIVRPNRRYRRYAFFDDFDCTANGFVITAPSDLARPQDYLPPVSGAVIFVGKDGSCVGSYRDCTLKHPSAVRVVSREGIPSTQPGDMFITEKHHHALYFLRPDPELRNWLVAG